jgi:hypothetical protein
MSIQERKAAFEAERTEKVYESTTLTFHGVEGYTVYNCSIPFQWNGKEYIFGRVEKFDRWADSSAMLFEKTGEDTYTLVPNSTTYQLEDPFIAYVQGEFTMGGTHVRKKGGEIDTYYGYFYRGTSPEDLTYFTTGPDKMKDIRLVDLKNGKIGVFSRPRSQEILEKYGSASMIGYTEISSLDQLTDEVVENATPITGIFDQGEWGGCNQAYLLENGTIGIIGHQSFLQQVEGGIPLEEYDFLKPIEGEKAPLSVYLSISFEFDPATFQVTNRKVIGTRSCYPAGKPKKPSLADCTFTSGMVLRQDGKVDLYGGLGDCAEGRIVIDYPFSCPLAE